MERISVKIRIETPIFTEKKRRVIIAGTGGNRRFSLFQRYILAKITDFNTGELALLLGDFFPDRQFIPQKNTGGDLDILDYIVRENGKWTLDIRAMSRSNKKNLSSLFHEEITLWNEKEARKKYGCADITRFFIDIENDRFYVEFSKLNNAKLADINKDDIPEKFFQVLMYEYQEAKPVWEDWDFTKLVLHKPHNNIYKAFTYYAHWHYTLLGLGLCKLSKEEPDAVQNCGTAKLFSAGEKLVDEILLEQIPKLANMGIERRFWLRRLVQEILESVPTNTLLYAPTEKNVFENQLASAIPGFLRSKKYDFDDELNNDDTYSSKEIRNIKNYMQRIEQYLDDPQDKNEYLNLKETGTYRKRADFLRRLTQKPSIRRHYSESELKIIEGFFNEKSFSLSLFTPLQGKEGDEASYLIDVLDLEEMELEEVVAARLDWAVFFEDVFKTDFDELSLREFIEHIPEHFDRFPLVHKKNSSDLKMTKYSEDMLFPVFCSIIGKPEDKDIKRHFLYLIRKVIKKINTTRAKIAKGANYES